MEIDPKIFDLIQILSEKLGTTVTELLPKYIKWVSINAISFCLWGIAFIYFGFDSQRKLIRFGKSRDDKVLSRDEWKEDDWISLGTIIKYICIFIGIFILFMNLANIFSPTPEAIKKLIRTVKGI